MVFLPSHKSNLDHLVLQYALFENGLPPNHTAGGINMNFFPVGPLVRRSGVFFIRRTFKDQPIYKFVLRSYIDYLIEKRFSLEWYVEGGRSRSGKLLPPRLGLMAYVADAFRRGKSDDVFLLPVSIAYDQIQDVGDYVAEQRGAKKERESFGWFVRLIRRLRGGYGAIHIRFGEPLSLAKALGHGPGLEESREEASLEVQKLAFEACVRINRVTPITPTSLVTLALLGRGDRALDVDSVVQSLSNLLFYVDQRKLPVTSDLQLDTSHCVQRVLDELVASGVVACFDEGPEAVYAIGPDQHLAAAYYRNTIIHFFVNGAIAELALLRAAEDDVEDRGAELWKAAMRLRDLLKFEFFFSEKETFRDELRAEIARPRRRVGMAARRRPAGDPGAAAKVPALPLAPRAAALPRGLPRDGRHPRASPARCAAGGRTVPRRVPGPGQAVPAAAAQPERRVGLARALRERAAAGAQPAPGGARRAGARRAPGGLRRGDSRAAAAPRRHRRHGRRAHRRPHAVAARDLPPLSGRLRVGRRDGGLPDRGSRLRGRQGALDLGHVLPASPGVF